MISCQNCHELLPEFSLGELDARDLRKVKFHLNNCRKCAVELAAYRQVWNTLPFALDPIEPPKELKVQLMDRVKSSPRVDQRAKRKQQKRRVGSPVTFRFDRKAKWYAIAATLLICLIGLNSLRWGSDDPADSLYADRATKQKVERLAASFQKNVQLIGQDGMPNFVFVSMRKGKAYETLNTQPSAYAIWNRQSDRWHVYMEEAVRGGESRSYRLWLQDAKGGLLASTEISPQKIGGAGIVFDSVTDRPITQAFISIEGAMAPRNGLSSRQAIGQVIFEADLITPVVPVPVN